MFSCVMMVGIGLGLVGWSELVGTDLGIVFNLRSGMRMGRGGVRGSQAFPLIRVTVHQQ